jgi:alkylation response protein AidB-like acyl-CoA dehydrogenase
MDFNFSDDQEQLRDAVRKWVDRSYDFERRRKAVKAGGFDRAAYGELADLGLTGLYVSEDQGGMGMGPVEAMVAMEELGRGVVLEPLAQTLIAKRPAVRVRARRIAVGLAAEDRRRRGDRRARLCRAQGALPARRLRDNGDAVRQRMEDQRRQEHRADRRPCRRLPRCRRTVKGKIALFLVERSAAGVATRGYGTQDGGRAAEVTLQRCAGHAGHGGRPAALEHAVDIGIAATCAEGVGVLDKTMDVTVEYMNTRKQFGVTLATFQALRHRMADMKMQLELARSMSYYASLKLNAPAESAAARWPAPSTSWACRCASSARTRCSCTAASA